MERHKASFYHSRNMPVLNPFLGDKNDRYRIFQEIEARNTRVKKPGLHLSVNPTVGDLVRLGDTGIKTEIDNLMNHLGYGNQPYFVYKHADLERVHFHIVSTRIDCETGKKIKDNYEREKTQKFIKSLEQKYQLTKDDTQEKLNYRFSGSSKNLKQNLESLFGQLNRMEQIASKEMYDQALGLFQVEIRKAGRGHLVFVTDENGSPIRHPVRMSDFEERPRFYMGNKLGGEQRESLNRTLRLPEGFKRELLNALLYQYRQKDDDEKHKLKRRREKKRNGRGKRP
ncbi:MAG: relaxase/mobilization nuclease domain-containing protein [Bacteroidales bacterium]|nr:relaxase/mobilization nuclease domain-containing protein [Bacteroidales bacterium]